MIRTNTEQKGNLVGTGEARIPRERLERIIKAQQDALDYAVEAAKLAKLVLQMYVPPELQKGGEFRRTLAVMDAISKGSSMAGPLLASACQRYAFEEAVRVALDVARQGGEEWQAGCEAVAAKLRGRT